MNNLNYKVLNEWVEDNLFRSQFQKVFAGSPYKLEISGLLVKFDLKDISKEWRKRI